MKWSVCFDAALIVSVESENSEEARSKAEELMYNEISKKLDEVVKNLGADIVISKPYLVINEETEEEILI